MVKPGLASFMLVRGVNLMGVVCGPVDLIWSRVTASGASYLGGPTARSVGVMCLIRHFLAPPRKILIFIMQMSEISLGRFNLLFIIRFINK